MKKRHLFLGIVTLGTFIGGVAFGITTNVKSYQAIQKCEIALNDESQDKKIEELKAKILELANNELIRSIVSYTTSFAGIAGFIVTLAKYRKYKAISSTQIAELVTKVGSENLTAKYEELEKTVVNELIKKYESVEKAISVMQKILILSQDKTTAGKVALMEYLEKKTEDADESVKETVSEVKEAVEEENKKQEETLSKVADDYVPVE